MAEWKGENLSYKLIKKRIINSIYEHKFKGKGKKDKQLPRMI